MKFGIFLLLQSPDMRPSQETYDHALEQGVLADQLGFDYIVAAEHHFSSYGFLPCPLLLISTLAERTRQSGLEEKASRRKSGSPDLRKI